MSNELTDEALARAKRAIDLANDDRQAAAHRLTLAESALDTAREAIDTANRICRDAVKDHALAEWVREMAGRKFCESCPLWRSTTGPCMWLCQTLARHVPPELL